MKSRLARTLRRLANRLEPQQWEIRMNCGTVDITDYVKNGREVEKALAQVRRRGNP